MTSAALAAFKPPPPPKSKEKLPEPEIKKKEELVEQEPEDQPPDQMEDTGKDDAPPGDDLGLDADGIGGGDGFGLKAKRGGRSITELGSGHQNLLKRYAWYTRILQDEIRDKVNKILEKIDDLPEGKHKMMLRIKLDGTGNIVFISIFKSSGNPKVDEVVEQAVTGFKVSEAPPDSMPKTMKVKVTFKS